jgi:hypothetical protein
VSLNILEKQSNQSEFLQAISIGLAALASASILTSPAKAAERIPAEIACPRTAVSPEAQKRIDAGEKPVIEKSWYRPGLVNPQGFCTITLSPDGTRMFQRYNEATSVGQIPIRFEYSEMGLYGYAGPKGLPLGTGQPDMVCWVLRENEYAVDCNIALTPDGTMWFRRKTGRGVDESAVSIDAKQMFGVDVKAPQAMVHYELVSTGPVDDILGFSFNQSYQSINVDCKKPYWKNTATEIKVSAGRRDGNAVVLVSGYEMTDADPNLFVRSGESPQLFPRFEAKGGNPDAIIGAVMNNEVVQVDVSTACEGKLSRAYLTELPRVMNHVYEIIKPRMLRQQ